ncbi:MAG TPA: hypothetical protein VFJ58_04765 [Armatimonadota bacterium]|nr:hypothetical protein [Armatimonadota bacterium]
MGWHLAVYIIAAIVFISLVAYVYDSARHRAARRPGPDYRKEENFAITDPGAGAQPNDQPPRSGTFGDR